MLKYLIKPFQPFFTLYVDDIKADTSDFTYVTFVLSRYLRQ